MLFLYHRALLTAFSVIALIQFTVARPFLLAEDNALVERSEASENAHLEHQWLYPRRGQGQITKDAKANPFKPKRKPAPPPGTGKKSTVEEAHPQESPNQHKSLPLPDSGKLTLSPSARNELDEMGVHGKARQNMIKWHKTQMKKEMKKNPLLNNGKASTGVIQQIVHKGGSAPAEKNRITAHFFNKDGNRIPNKLNGGVDHHFFAKNTNGLSKEGKDALKRKADTRGQSHQKSLSKIQTPGTSNDKSKKEAQAKNSPNRRKALPNAAKLTLGPHARDELNKMGLHGKARRNMIKWHKTQMKKEMKTNPLLNHGKARTGEIRHIAHEGGSDPNEKNHITAHFFDKDRDHIHNTFNGGPNHHVYVKSTNGLSREGKAALKWNNAGIRGESTSHLKTLSKTKTPGKSSNKGKGKQKFGKGFSKNVDKRF